MKVLCLSERCPKCRKRNIQTVSESDGRLKCFACKYILSEAEANRLRNKWRIKQ